MSRNRNAVVSLARSWLGKNESDGSFKSIIDIYNGYKGKLPRGIKMQYSWAWCACTWSALAIKLGYTGIMPIEISCYYLIEAAKKMGVWVEADGYIPKPGDAVLYDWQDTGAGDNTGTPDHVGVVEVVSGGSFTVIEGNYSNAVKRREMAINGCYIRGFICPKYDEDSKSTEELAKEVIAGRWGNGDERKKRLREAGYDYSAIQKMVNEKAAPAKKSIDEIAREVIKGLWGTGAERKKKLVAARYDDSAVQKRVNELLR